MELDLYTGPNNINSRQVPFADAAPRSNDHRRPANSCFAVLLGFPAGAAHLFTPQERRSMFRRGENVLENLEMQSRHKIPAYNAALRF